MKCARLLAAVLLLAAAPPAAAGVEADPLNKVVSLLEDLSAKVAADGEKEAKAYQEYVEWCDDASKNKNFEIKTATAKKAKLEAVIGKAAGDIEASSSKVETLAASIAQGSSELKDATLIREKESEDFKAGEGELMDAIDTLGRAVSAIEREMAKSPAAFAQVDTSSMQGLLSSLRTLVDAASFSSADQKRLAALVQSQQGAGSDDDLFGAPAAAVYKSQSGGILDVLEDLKEKAEEELSELRKAEASARHNYDMARQSLEDQIDADTADLDQEKASKAATAEAQATAEGDLALTGKDLADAKAALETANRNCMQVASDHEATAAARAVELKTIADAKQLLEGSTAGAAAQTYSLLQLRSRLHSHADLAKAEVETIVRRLAQEHHSAALAQLASRISAVMRFGASTGEDPFAKVKGLIADMVAKLESEAGAEATEKAYCDEQMAKTQAKKEELEADLSKLSAKIGKAAAASAGLKEDVKELQAELAALARQQAEMGKIRQETHADYVQAKADLEQGLAGVRKALVLLRDHYGGSALLQGETNFAALMQQPARPEIHSKATGAGRSIIGILEVVESDFAKNLAAEETQEDDAQSAYEKQTQENSVTKTMKDQDLKYSTQEFKSLDKSVAEMASDRETTDTELSAVLEYFARIKDRCIAKPEAYEERKGRRAAEIAGLKEALSILEDETALVQRGKRGHRGQHFLGL